MTTNTFSDKTFSDEEIRDAVLRAAKTLPISVSVDPDDTYATVYVVNVVRNILDQLFRKLPNEPGSIIENVTDRRGCNYQIMTLDSAGDWIGVTTGEHTFEYIHPDSIVSWEPFENN